MFQALMQRLAGFLRYTWGYMGTLAAMGLLIGVLGMGLFHAFTRDAEFQAVRCYSGLFNSSDASEPSGIDELPSSSLPAIPHLRFEYGKNGRLERLVHISAEGHPSAMPGSSVAEQRLTYDDHDRLISKSNYTATGEPTTDASGVHARVFRYDSQGRRTCTTFMDRAGNAVVPRMPGYAMECITYDEKNRPLSIEYKDGKGNPVINCRGESHVVFFYDDTHGTSTRTNLIAGIPADNASGIAKEVCQHTDDGKCCMTSWYTAAGEHAHHPSSGACSILTDSSRDGTLLRERYCSENGNMRRKSDVCAEKLTRLTPNGKVEWECFNDADGLPCMNAALGYAERVCEYGQDGALIREFFWDAEGNPCESYEKRYCSDPSGKHILTLHSDGSTELRRNG